MSKVDIPPKSNDPTDPIEWNQQAQDFFVATVTEVSQAPETKDSEPDMTVETAGRSPAKTQKTLQQGALDRIFTWWKDANNTERTIAVIGGAAVIALGAYLIKKAIDGVVRLGSWVVEKLSGYRNETIEGIIKAGLGIAVAKAFYDAVTSEEIIAAFVADGWKGVGELLLAKILENAIDIGNIGEDKWNTLREKIPQLPEYGELEELINARGDAIDKAKDAMEKMRQRLEEEGEKTGGSLWDRVIGVAPILGGAGKKDKEKETQNPVIPKEERNHERYIYVDEVLEEWDRSMEHQADDIRGNISSHPLIVAKIAEVGSLHQHVLSGSATAYEMMRFVFPQSYLMGGLQIGVVLSFYSILKDTKGDLESQQIPKDRDEFGEWIENHEGLKDDPKIRAFFTKKENVDLLHGVIIKKEPTFGDLAASGMEQVGATTDGFLDFFLQKFTVEGDSLVAIQNMKGIKRFRTVINSIADQVPGEGQQPTELFKHIQSMLLRMSEDDATISQSDYETLQELASAWFESIDGAIEFEIQNHVIVYSTDYKGRKKTHHLGIAPGLKSEQTHYVAEYFSTAHTNASILEELGQATAKATLETIEKAREGDLKYVFLNNTWYALVGAKSYIVGTGMAAISPFLDGDQTVQLQEYAADTGKGIVPLFVLGLAKDFATTGRISITGRLVKTLLLPARLLPMLVSPKAKLLNLKYGILHARYMGQTVFSNKYAELRKLTRIMTELYEFRSMGPLRHLVAKVGRMDRVVGELINLTDDPEVQKILREFRKANYSTTSFDDAITRLQKVLSQAGTDLLDEARAAGASVDELDRVTRAVGELAGEVDEVKPRATSAGAAALTSSGDELIDEALDRANKGAGSVAEADEVLERLASESDEVPRPNAGKVVEEVSEEGAERVRRLQPLLEKIKGLAPDKAREILEKASKNPGVVRLVNNMFATGLHVAAPVGLIYDMYVLERDAKDTVKTHIGILAAFQAGRLAYGKPVSKVSVFKLSRALLVGVGTYFGIEISSVEDWIEETFFKTGEFSTAVWNEGDDFLLAMESFIANRALLQRRFARSFYGKTGTLLAPAARALYKKSGTKWGVEIAGRALAPVLATLNRKLVEKVGKTMIGRLIKTLGKKAAIAVGGKAAAAGGAAVVPVAGWVVSAGLLAWTAYDGYQIYKMIDKARRVSGAFDDQSTKDIEGVIMPPEHEELIAERVNANLEAEELPYEERTDEEKMIAQVENFESVARCNITINRADGTSETYHYAAGEPRYVKIVTPQETLELDKEELEAAEEWEPGEFVKEKIPYDKLNNEDLMQYYNLQILKLKDSQKWSQLMIDPVSSSEVVVERGDFSHDKFTIKRNEKNQWTIESQKTGIQIPGIYGFHDAVALSSLNMYTINFLLKKIDEDGDNGWKSEGGKKSPFYVNGDQMGFEKDGALDKNILSEEWMQFYQNSLGLTMDKMDDALDTYFKAITEKELPQLIGD